MHPMLLGSPARRLFAALHPAPGTARGLVLMCPPLLHEHQRSYRFFSQLADRLAGAGLACLRFDYYGCGDSGGGDGQFSLASAQDDIALAADALRQAAGPGPLIVLGARASALLAHRAAPALSASALWLWQPVTDGARWLQRLEARDRAERDSRHRYPFGPAAAPRDDALMGFALPQAVREALAACSIHAPPPGMPMAVVDGEDGEGAGLAADAIVSLPGTATAWVEEVDFTGMIAPRDAEPALEALLADLSRWTGTAQAGALRDG